MPPIQNTLGLLNLRHTHTSNEKFCNENPCQSSDEEPVDTLLYYEGQIKPKILMFVKGGKIKRFRKISNFHVSLIVSRT